jgi:outer membrane cobalamin receptor
MFLFNSSFTFPNNEPSVKKGTIKAQILDGKTNEPIEYANVTLHNAKDSTFLGGTVSGNNGELVMPNIPEGNYFIKVSYIGYEKQIVEDVKIDKEKYEASLGIIKLFTSDVELGEVNVVAEKAPEELRLDKKVINVSQNINASGGTALDVLQNQPSVQVDQDGNVSLRGSSNFTIQVNGKPYPIQGGDALRQIPANLVESIEIITNPSAKYDAEGAAGIINIVMKKQDRDNMNGIVNAGLGSRTKYNGDFTLNYKSGDYTLSGSLDYRKNSNYISQLFDRKSVVQNNSYFLNTDVRGNFIRENYTAKASIDYAISDKSSISFSNSYGDMTIKRSSIFKFADMNESNPLLSGYTLGDDRNDYSVKYLNSILFFSQQFTPKIDELTVEVNYTNVSLPSAQLSLEYQTDNSFNQMLANNVQSELINNTKRNEGRARVNYSYVFDKDSKFETGAQANLFYNNLDIISRGFDFGNQQWINDSRFSNQFDFRNNVYSAYATYSNMLAGFNYQLGFRLEQTDRVLDQKTLGKDYSYNQTHLFPSLSISTSISPEQQIQFSYSRRINRPQEMALNPFPNFSNSYVTFIGNPSLLPELTNSIELNYQHFLKGLFFSVQTYFRQSNNSILRTQELDQNGFMTLTFANAAENTVLGAELSSSVSIIPWLRLDPAVNLFNRKMNGSLNGINLESEKFSWSARLNSTLILTSTTRLQLNMNYFGKQIDIQQTTDPIFSLTISARQELLDKKLIATISAQNLFGAGKFGFNSYGPNFNMVGSFRPEAPVFRLTLSYNFNNYKNSSRTNDRVDINVGEGM